MWIGNQAPFDFDVSVKDIYTSIFTGAKLGSDPKADVFHAAIASGFPV